MDIKRLRIQNFRCYSDVDIELDRSLLLITGSNDGGKSALLRAIELFLYSRAKPDDADFRSLDPEGEGAADEIRIIGHVESEDGVKKIRRRFSMENGDLEWSYEEETDVPQDEKLKKELSTFKKERSADEQRAYLEELGIEEFGSNQDKRYQQLLDHANGMPSEMAWVEISTPDLPDVNRYISEEMGDPVKDVQKFLKSAVEDRVREIKQSGGEYARVESKIEQTGNEELEVLEEVFSRYDYGEEETRLEANLDFDLLKSLSLDALNVRQGGNVRRIAKLGAARRRKLLLALQEWRLESLRSSEKAIPLILLYDEPDTHFDYEAQRKLFGILRGLAQQEGVQVIVASHSLNLIDSVEVQDIVYLDQDTDENDVTQTHIRRLGDWGEIHEIARMLGLRNHIVLNACILCTEGKTEERLIPALYRLDRGRSLASIGVELVQGSDRGDDAAWRLCQHALRNHRDTFLFLDSDAKRSGTSKTIDLDAIHAFNEAEGEELASTDKNVVFLGEKEIEDIFANRTLAAAFERYMAEDVNAKLRDGDDSKVIIAESRTHPDGLCGGLQKEVYQRTETSFSKTAFCEHLIDVIQEDPQTYPIPDEITEAFDLLDQYVDHQG